MEKKKKKKMQIREEEEEEDSFRSESQACDGYRGGALLGVFALVGGCRVRYIGCWLLGGVRIRGRWGRGMRGRAWGEGERFIDKG